MPFSPNAPPSARVVLTTFGTDGDLLPFLAMSRGLQRRGHPVLLVIPRWHEARVRDSGLPYEAFGTREDAQRVLDDPDLWNERRGFGVVWRGLLPGLEELLACLEAHAQAGPCTMVSHPLLGPVAAIVRERFPHTRLVGAYLAPANPRTVQDPLTVGSLSVPRWMPRALCRALWTAIDRFFIDPALLPGLNAARLARGLRPVTSFLPHMEAAWDAAVGLFPPWFGARQPDWPRRFVEGDFPLPPASPAACLPADVADFLAAGAPPVAFTAGTGHQHADRFFAAALMATQALGERAIFIHRCAGQLPAPLPPQVLAVAQVPFDGLFPRLSALVHHGGIGTLAEAFRAGLPQLVAPFAFDQFDNGRRVRHLGCGDVLPATRLTPRRLTAALRGLRQPSVRTTAQGRSAAMAGEGCLERMLDGVETAIATAWGAREQARASGRTPSDLAGMKEAPGR